jgi:hypothetical protein
MIQAIILGMLDSLGMPALRRRMIPLWRNAACESVALSEFPWVDRARLEFYEQSFSVLGFEPRGDLSPRQHMNGVTGFMRLMGHNAERAVVSLLTVKPSTSAPTPLRCAIMCPLSDRWSVTATDLEADAILSQLALPRAVGLRNCDAAPDQLWRETLRVRDQLVLDKGLRLVGDGSLKDFTDFTFRSNNERADLLMRMNPVWFAIRRRMLMRNSPPRRKLWTGEWKCKVPILDWQQA